MEMMVAGLHTVVLVAELALETQAAITTGVRAETVPPHRAVVELAAWQIQKHHHQRQAHLALAAVGVIPAFPQPLPQLLELLGRLRAAEAEAALA